MYTHSPPLELFYTPPPTKSKLQQSTKKSIRYTHNNNNGPIHRSSSEAPCNIYVSNNLNKTMNNKSISDAFSSFSISPTSSMPISLSVNTAAAISDTETNDTSLGKKEYFKPLPPTPPNAYKKRNNLLKMEEQKYTECQYEVLKNHINFDSMKGNIDICFDKYTVKKANNHNPNFIKHTVLSSHKLISGYYEWSIKILKCEGSVQEIGIVSNPDIDNINIKQNQCILETEAFGARAIYGNRLESIYYASYNDNNKQRCYKNLSNKKLETCWAKGDIIKICLNLDKYHISFFLNHKKVRKKISVQPNKIYYPIISFVGDFKYEIK